jgi:beta-N-acetylhexosaminidase
VKSDGDRGAVRPATRGRRTWLVGCPMTIIAMLGGCGMPPTAAPSVAVTPSRSIPSHSPTSSPSGIKGSTPLESFTEQESCAQVVANMSLSERVGQLLMVGISSGGISAREQRIVEETRAGSILLLGNSAAGVQAIRRVVSSVRSTARSPEGVQVMLAADQEGGLVQRLKGPGFTTIPSATVQARQSDTALQQNAYDWGRELKSAGIDANLAPVADVVPMTMVWVNQPIGQLRRGYSQYPQKVAAKVTAFTEGMDRAGVATAVKHFPGLGRVRGNTDYMSRVVDSRTTRDDAALAGFRAAVDADVDMVMVSSATYRKIDAEHRAAFSTTIMEEMLRKDLRFSGVVISDDLAAAAMRVLPAEERARRFISSGGDLIIVGNARVATRMADAIKDEASDDSAFEKRVTESAARVVAMKERRGLAHC